MQEAALSPEEPVTPEPATEPAPERWWLKKDKGGLTERPGNLPAQPSNNPDWPWARLRAPQGQNEAQQVHSGRSAAPAVWR